VIDSSVFKRNKTPIHNWMSLFENWEDTYLIYQLSYNTRQSNLRQWSLEIPSRANYERNAGF
jgi:hypothetical protein